MNFNFNASTELVNPVGIGNFIKYGHFSEELLKLWRHFQMESWSCVHRGGSDSPGEKEKLSSETQ